MKRFLSLVFSLVLLVSFSATAFASDSDSSPLSLSVDSDFLMFFNNMFNYNAVTGVASFKFSQSQLDSMSESTRKNFLFVEKNPSSFIPVFDYKAGSSLSVYFIEKPSNCNVNSPFLMGTDSSKFSVSFPNNTPRYLTFTANSSNLHTLSTQFSKADFFYTSSIPRLFNTSYDYSPYFIGFSSKDVLSDLPITSFVFLPKQSSITVNYQNSDGSTAFPSVTSLVPVGDDYSFVSPSLVGCTPNQLIVSGTTPDSDLTFTVVYNPNPYRLTVNFADERGRSVAPPVIETVYYKSSYSVTCPAVSGYTASSPVVSGIMPPNDFGATGNYVASVYTLTVLYQGADGSTVHPPNISLVSCGDVYDIPSPIIDDFDPSFFSATGTMPPNDHTVKIVYSKKMSSYDRMLSESLGNLFNSVSSNFLTISGVGILLFASILLVFLLLHILRKFSVKF